MAGAASMRSSLSHTSSLDSKGSRDLHTARFLLLVFALITNERDPNPEMPPVPRKQKSGVFDRVLGQISSLHRYIDYQGRRCLLHRYIDYQGRRCRRIFRVLL